MTGRQAPIFGKKEVFKVKEIYGRDDISIYHGGIVETRHSCIIAESKTYCFNEKQNKEFRAEADVMFNFNHPCLCPIKGIMCTKKDKAFRHGIIYDIAGLTPLSAVIGKIKFRSSSSGFSTGKILTIIGGITSALKYLHNNNIVFGELSINSVFLDEKNKFMPRLCIFGVSKVTKIQKIELQKNVTFSYAPEFYGTEPKYTKELDYFMYGMLIFRILNNKIVFRQNAGYSSFVENIVNGFRPVIPGQLYPFLRELIDQSWNKVPTARLCFDEDYDIFKDGIKQFCSQEEQKNILGYLEKIEKDLVYTAKPTLKPTFSRSTNFSTIFDENYHLPDLQNIENTKQYQLVSSLRSIPPNIMLKTARLMLIQEALNNVVATNVTYIAKWLLENNVFTGNDSDDFSFAASFTTATCIRYHNFKIYGELMRRLSIDTRGQKMPSVFLKYLFGDMIKHDPFPRSLAALAVVRELIHNRVYTPEIIVKHINSYVKVVGQKKIAMPLFCWFAPELEEHNHKLYTEMRKYLFEAVKDEFCPIEFKNFVADFDDLKKNNWNHFKLRARQVRMKNDFNAGIRADELEVIEETVKSNSKFNGRIDADIFELCYIAHDNPPVIMYAAAHGCTKIFQSMQIMNGQTSIMDKSGRYVPLFVAAGGEPSIMRQSIRLPYDFDGAVCAAAAFHRNEYIEQLVRENGCSLRRSDKFGKLPISAAAAANNVAALVTMLKEGISPNSPEMFGRTAIHAAAERGFPDPLLLLLSAAETDPNAADLFGNTPLHVAVDCGNTNAVRTILECPRVAVNQRNEDGCAPIHVAAKRGMNQVLQLLLSDRRTDVNAVTKRGNTAAHICAKAQNLAALKMIFQVPTLDLRLSNRRGLTAYDCAVQTGVEEVMKLFEDYAARKFPNSLVNVTNL